MDTIKYEIADLNYIKHAEAIKFLLNEYARELKGYNKELPSELLKNVIPGLKNHNHLIILAMTGKTYAGMAICFITFSTFYAKPILNIHDLTVLKEYRNNGIATGLMKSIENHAKKIKCCKLTLEVQEMNQSAISLYENLGFTKNGYNPKEGKALFLMKIL